MKNLSNIFSENDFSELSEQELAETVLFVSRNMLVSKNGNIYASTDTKYKDLKVEGIVALNVADLSEQSLASLVQNFHIVEERGDDFVLFFNEDIDKIQSLQGKDVTPFHISDLNIYLTQEDVSQKHNKELSEKDAEIAALKALLEQKEVPTKPKKQTE